MSQGLDPKRHPVCSRTERVGFLRELSSGATSGTQGEPEPHSGTIISLPHLGFERPSGIAQIMNVRSAVVASEAGLPRPATGGRAGRMDRPVREATNA